MMTETEIQLVSYVEGILRTRGYTDLAQSLTSVLAGEIDQRARRLSPPSPMESSSTG